MSSVIHLKVLLSDAITSYRNGLAKAKPPTFNPRELFSSQYLLKMARGLSLPEISVLLNAERIREAGLALARSGDVNRGRIALDEAREVCLQARLSKEATLAAQTFQTAAEAYVQYKVKNYLESFASLINSLESCRILNDEYDYNMEMRRIHLARNIVRIESFSDNLSEATRLASSMVRYIQGHGEFWPLNDLPLWSKTHSLAVQERWWCMDELLMEIGLLLAKPYPTAKQLLKLVGRDVFREETGNEFARVHTWFAAKQASVEDDAVGFVNHAIIFFSGGPGYLDRAWRELLVDFVQVCKKVAPELVSDLKIERPYSTHAR